MLVRKGQITPMHFHWNKMEDIINRGGGNLMIELWKAGADEQPVKGNFSVQIDGVTRNVKAGEIIIITPGESITIEPYVYHKFWAENKTSLIGEVSTINDDAKDNRFLEPLGRFPEILEDEPPFRLLCTEYPKN